MEEKIVVKRTGATENFDRKKVKRTCKRVGVHEDVAEEIASSIENQVIDGISTKGIEIMVMRELAKRIK